MTRLGGLSPRPFAAFMVQPGMFGLRHHLQVVWVAVKRVAVYVMHNLAFSKPSPDLVLGGDCVVEHLAAARHVNESAALRDAKLIGNRSWRVAMKCAFGAGHVQPLTVGLCDASEVVSGSAPLNAKLNQPVSNCPNANTYPISYGLGRSPKINILTSKPVRAYLNGFGSHNNILPHMLSKEMI